MATNLWHDLPSGDAPPKSIHAVIEIPKGSRNKYEYSKEYGTLMLDRVLYSSIHYPGDYGFVPRTYFEDGDPVDILVMTHQPTFPGCLVVARPVGMFRMLDNGEPDNKILAVPQHDPSYESYQELGDVPPHYIVEVEHFFSTYKTLEGGEVKVDGWAPREEAEKTILKSMERYRENIDQLRRTSSP